MTRTSRITRRIAPVTVLAALALLPAPARASHNNCPNDHEMPGFTVGQVNATNQRDYWQHTALVLPRHTYTLEDFGGDADLFVYNAGLRDTNGCTTQVCASTSAGGTDRCTVTGLGTFYALVLHYSGENVYYELTVSEV